MDPDIINDVEFFQVINYVAANPRANQYLWDWTRANYQQLVDRWVFMSLLV